MPESVTPQPSVDRIVPAAGRPLVVGLTPGQSPVVARTAASWALAVGGRLVFGYVDPDRVVESEAADGSVRHSPLSPDADDDWQGREAALRAQVAEALAGVAVDWEFRYLAGRPDRALTHLARALDAAGFVVGGRRPGRVTSLGSQLARHQHRPVLVVPVAVVDWKHALQ